MADHRPSSEEADWQDQEQGSQTTLLSATDYDDNEKRSSLPLPTHKPSSTRKWRAQGFALGLILGLAITAFITTLLRSTRFDNPPNNSNPTHHIDYSLIPQGTRPSIHLPPSTLDASTGKPSSWFSGPCGNTTSTAEAANCHFSPIAFSWLPPSCWTPADAVEEMEFLSLHDWKYYLSNDMSPNGTESDEVSLQELLDHGEHWGVKYVYTDWDWHLTHCVYMWRRMHRMLLGGGKVDGYVGEMEHTVHCGEKLLKKVQPGWRMRTRIWVKYPSCY